MRYEKSERVQHEDYCCSVCFMDDVLSTLFDEDNDYEMVHIIANGYITEQLFKIICQIQSDDFEFDLRDLDFSKDSCDEYRITIANDGTVYIEPSTDDEGEYFDCDGFIFADIDVDDEVFCGNNRRCDGIVFDIDEF